MGFKPAHAPLQPLDHPSGAEHYDPDVSPHRSLGALTVVSIGVLGRRVEKYALTDLRSAEVEFHRNSGRKRPSRTNLRSREAKFRRRSVQQRMSRIVLKRATGPAIPLTGSFSSGNHQQRRELADRITAFLHPYVGDEW